MESSALWFRHGLRLHDNPSLHEAIKNRDRLFYPIFIFDGESAGITYMNNCTNFYLRFNFFLSLHFYLTLEK